MLPVVLLAALSMGVFSLLKLGPSLNGTGIDYPYRASGPVLSPSEVVFHRALTEAMGDEYIVGFKVRLLEVVQPKRGIERSRWEAASRRLGDEHVDFVLLNPSDFRVVAAIELEASPRKSDQEFERDEFLKRAFGAAEIPYVLVPCSKHYSVGLLRDQVFDAMGVALAESRPY